MLIFRKRRVRAFSGKDIALAQSSLRRTLRIVIAAAAVLSAQATQAIADSAKGIAKSADDIAYTPVPNYGGLEVALLEGHPEKEGYYVMRVKFPDGVQSPPHDHDQDRYITVIKGVWYFGTGASKSCEKATPLPAGSFAKHEAGLVHYDGACDGDVIVQISGFGPVHPHFVGGKK